MTAVHLGSRNSTDQKRDAPAYPRFEPLRDQIFAACAYSFVIAVPITGLLTAHPGRLTLAACVTLTVALVPVNVCLMRCFARLRHAVTAHQTAGREDGRIARSRSRRP